MQERLTYYSNSIIRCGQSLHINNARTYIYSDIMKYKFPGKLSHLQNTLKFATRNKINSMTYTHKVLGLCF